MGQFYYRPVPTGYEEMGRSLAAGITGGVGSYYEGKKAQRQEGIEDEDRTRRRSREALDLDVMLASAGGGRGAAPTPVELPREGSALNDRRGLDLVRDMDAVQNRDYRQLGDYFIEDPTSRGSRLERDTFELGQSRAATERDRRGEALGGAGAALVGGGDRAPSADALSAFYGEGLDPMAVLREARSSRELVPGTDAFNDNLEVVEKIKQQYRGDADGNDEGEVDDSVGGIRFNRAYSIVEDMAREYNPEGYPVGRLTSAQKAQLMEDTHALLAGEDAFGEREGRRPDAGAREGYVTSLEDVRAPARALVAPATKQTITQDQADYLREEYGMSDDDINRLYIIG